MTVISASPPSRIYGSPVTLEYNIQAYRVNSICTPDVGAADPDPYRPGTGCGGPAGHERSNRCVPAVFLPLNDLAGFQMGYAIQLSDETEFWRSRPGIEPFRRPILVGGRGSGGSVSCGFAVAGSGGT